MAVATEPPVDLLNYKGSVY